MSKCCIRVCRNYPGGVKNSMTYIDFYRMPRNAYARRIWTEIIRISQRNFRWGPNRNTVICSEHFRRDDYDENDGCVRKILKSQAIPTKALFLTDQNGNLCDYRETPITKKELTHTGRGLLLRVYNFLKEEFLNIKSGNCSTDLLSAAELTAKATGVEKETINSIIADEELKHNDLNKIVLSEHNYNEKPYSYDQDKKYEDCACQTECTASSFIKKKKVDLSRSIQEPAKPRLNILRKNMDKRNFVRNSYKKKTGIDTSEIQERNRQEIESRNWLMNFGTNCQNGSGSSNDAIDSASIYVFLNSDTEQTQVKEVPEHNKRVTSHNFPHEIPSLESNSAPSNIFPTSDTEQTQVNLKPEDNEDLKSHKLLLEISPLQTTNQKRRNLKRLSRNSLRNFESNGQNGYGSSNDTAVSAPTDVFLTSDTEQTQVKAENEVATPHNLLLEISPLESSTAPNNIFLTSDTEQTRVKMEAEDSEDVTSQKLLLEISPLESKPDPTCVFLPSNTEQTQVKMEPEDSEVVTSQAFLHKIPPLESNDEYFNQDEDAKMDIEQYTFTGATPNIPPNPTASEQADIKTEPADDH